METLEDLQREQIRVRSSISRLYGDLLELTPPSRKIVNASHEWTLRHIESLVNDLLFNLPNEKPPANPYSEYFLLSGINPHDLSHIIEALVEALHSHSTLGTRIEQVAKGVA